MIWAVFLIPLGNWKDHYKNQLKKGADTIIYLASSNEIKNFSGKYFVYRKQAKIADKNYTENNEQ